MPAYHKNPAGHSFGEIKVTPHCMIRYRDRICNAESRGLLRFDYFALVAFEFSRASSMPYEEQKNAIHSNRWKCSFEDFARSRFYRNDQTSNVFVCVPENDKFVLLTCWRDLLHAGKEGRPEKFNAIAFRDNFRTEFEQFKTRPAAA